MPSESVSNRERGREKPHTLYHMQSFRGAVAVCVAVFQVHLITMRKGFSGCYTKE